MTRGVPDLDKIEGEQKPEESPAPEGEMASLVALFKLSLGEAVKDVRVSTRLTDSAVCLVADENDMDMHLARLLRQHGQQVPEAKRILEINPTHPLIRRLDPGRQGRCGDRPR